MNNVCSLNLNENFTKEYISLVRELSKKDNPKEIKQEYLKQLKSLKSKYSSYATDDNFFNSIRSIIDESFDIQDILEGNQALAQVLSQDYNGELSVYDPRFVESTLDDGSKTDELDSTKQEKENDQAIKESIIAKYFPMASDARLAFEHQFKNSLIQAFFFNNDGGPRINLSNEDMDKSVKQYRKDLSQYLNEWVRKNDPGNYNSFRLKTIENKLSYFKNVIGSPKFNINDMELIKIPIVNRLSDEDPLKTKLKAYMAYIALNHFDEMVESAFGDSVSILYKGNYNTDEIKYRINLGNNNSQGWSQQGEDVDETEEIGGVIRLFMESLDMYDMDGQILPIKMSFSDVKSGLGAIMNLFNSTTTTLGSTLTRNIDLDTNLLNLKDNLEKFGINKFYKEGWDTIYSKYVEGKSLGQLIAQAKNKPALLMPLLFTILATNPKQFFNNRYQEKQAVYSLWKNLFDMNNENSLINRTLNSGGINIDSADLYSFVSTLFVNIENIPVIEYRKDQDRISTIGLRQNTSNSKLNAQKYNWAAKYNVNYPQQFKTFTIDDFEKGSAITKVRIPKSDIVLQISENSVITQLQSGKAISIKTLTPELQEFLSEVLDARIDNDFFDIYKSLGGELKDLFDIAGSILYSYKVGKTISKEILKNSNQSERKTYDEEIKNNNYFENDRPIMRGSMQPELISRSVFPKIRTFSMTLDILQGYSKENTAKDGSGKQIALLGLSSLASKYMELVYNHNLANPNSILKGFNIYDTFEEIEFMRDYAGGDAKKEATTFSEAEFFEANFLYDFYEGQVAITKDGKYSDLRKNNSDEPTKFRIMGPVVSDKFKLPKLRFDWKGFATLPDGTKKRYLDLTTKDIYDIQQKEFGDYYEALHNRILQDLRNITPYIQILINNLQESINQTTGIIEEPSIVVLDYDQDYKSFITLCEKYNQNPENLIHQALVLYQKEAREKGLRDDNIKIIKGIHYLKGMHNNPALFHQLNLYGRGIPYSAKRNLLDTKYLPNLNLDTINETPEQARERLNLQLVSELLQNEIELRVGSKDSNTKDSATYAAELFNEDGVWRKGRNIIIAKILNEKNIEQDISSLRNFQNWKEYQNLIEFFKSSKLPEKYDVTNPKFELSSTLNAINTIKKYNIFRFKEIQDYLIDDYIQRNLYPSENIEKIISNELRNKFPNWKEETIIKKTQEQISSMSEEDIIRKKAQYGLNLDIKDGIIGDLGLNPFGKSEYFDFDSTINKVSEFINSNPQTIEEEKLNKIKERLNQPIIYSIQLNPEIERYQALNNWLGEAYQLTTVGTFIAHPGDANASTIYNYEYRNFGQQVKRNVSHTATKHREVQNSIKGIRNKVRIAIITDAENSYITFKGDYGNDVEVHNGATFYNGSMVDLDNNSLGADAMGQDKKPFIHAIDPETGIGIIIKTAGFAVANSYIQKSPEAFGRINRKMNDTIKWSDTLKKYGYPESYLDWTVDFNGQTLNINPIYIYQNGKWYKRSEFKFNPETGETTYLEQLVADNGEVLNVSTNGTKSAGIIDSNWQLWNLFGGAYSGHIENGKLSYINDENSFKVLNYVMNHTGKVVDENIPKWDQSNIRQIIKESQIDMMPTTEAVKFGAANINNVNEIFYNDDYIPTYLEVFSDDMGEQLDAEHTAEGGHVSLMTQVINALGARGYSTQEAEECYRALELLAEQSFEEAFDKLQQLNINPTIEDRENFKLAIANIMLSTLKNVSISDGNILSAIAQGLKKIQKFGNIKQLEGIFPISSPQIYANLFSKLASTLEKAAVRLKFDGGMLVLNPSDGIYQIINGKLLGTISKEEVDKLQTKAIENPIKSSSELQFGHKYYIIYNDGNSIVVSEPKLIDKIEDFYEIKNHLANNSLVIEAFQEGLSLQEDGSLVINGEFRPIGRDLATYGCIIKESNSDRTFNLWETDVINCLFSYDKDNGRFQKLPNVPQTLLQILWNKYQQGQKEVTLELLQELEDLGIQNLLQESDLLEEALLNELNKFGIKEINSNLMHSYLERAFQDTLNSISSGIRKHVIINGERINIDKSGTIVSPYEAILPMIYKTSFGLRNGDTVGEIEQDKYFFVRRFAENATSKFYSESNRIYNVDGSEFDLELKRTSGDHLYLAHTSRDLSFNEEIENFPTEVFGEALYRVNPKTGKRMYQIPSTEDENGQLIANCRIFKAFNGAEIIQTEDLLFFLNQGKYNSISFGNFEETSDEDLEKILTALEQSKNKVAKNKAQYVLNAVTGKVHTNIKGIQEADPTYTLAIPAEIQTEIQLNPNIPEKYTSISQIFHGNGEELISINALHNHELYKQDAANQQNLLNGLIIALDTDKNNNDINETALKNFLKNHPHMQGIIDYGAEQHISFLTSLEAVVSRTPAQSHQSFMAMKVVGFDTNTTNSIFVSRMQLFLQGSDFDIDKANYLGLKIENGKIITWSPYFDLSSKERENDSESLPFPSGRSLIVKDDTTKLPWDVIDKNYQKLEIIGGYAFVDNNGNIIKALTSDKGKSYSLEFYPNQEGLNTNTYLLQHAVIKNFKDKIIISNDVLDSNVFKFDENGKYIETDIINDYNLYLSSLDLSKQNGKFNNLKDVGLLIRTFTNLREIPSEFDNYIDIVNKHNTMFLKLDGTKDKKRDEMKRKALYNFISIKTKNISKDPINLIQGQSGIDIATDEVKNLVKPGGKFDRLSSIATTSDHRSILARMKQLVLTLTGKQNVGIVASAMKVFEAMSHYYYKTLANGTLEEQERLLSNITILGKKLPLIANSFVKNPDTILSNKVLKAYQSVNNFQDAFIMMSALLSLATDNAKDPTLSKLNATPQTLGCYTAGLVLGLSIEEVADLLISDTGLLLTKMLRSDVFNPKDNQFNKLSDAIRFIRTIPTLPKNIDLSDYLTMFGFKLDESGQLDKDVEGNTLWSADGRKKFKQMAMFLLNPDTFKLESDGIKLARKAIKRIENDKHYWGWNEQKEQEYRESTGKERENLEKKFKEYQRLKELKESYEEYLRDSESAKAQQANKEILKQQELVNKLSSKENIQKINALKNSTLGEKEALQSIFEWIRYREIIENDFITIDGKKHSRLENIRKLNSFNEEMGDLRTVLKLNQGLPNSVQEQLSWINNFRGILSRAARRQNRKIKDESNSPLAKFKSDYNSLDLDLNRFLNDIQYQQDAIRAYESTKVGVNILDVMLNVPHYTGYMKTMNLLYEGGKNVSKNYATQAWIATEILPELSLKTSEQTEQFFKTLNPVIFQKINNDFLWQQQIELEIPKFKIINNELIESFNEDGSVKTQIIRLGTKEGNEIYKQYCVNYLYPYLVNNYPDNAFVKAISLRTYGYNLDHQISVNIAKRTSYNMTNPQSNTQFNEVKKALGELNGIRGLVEKLFYYNLIAYNGQPGNQSLTDLFEDFFVYDTNDVITKYNSYITYLDESNVSLFTDNDKDYLFRVLAPKVYITDDISGMKYFWVTNPENNKDVLIQVEGEPSEEELAIRSQIEEAENQFEGNIDDNDFESYSRYNSYKTLEQVKKQLTAKLNKFSSQKKEITEANNYKGITPNVSKKFILGKDIINESNIFDSILSSEYKKKTWSELPSEKKNKVLKKHSKEIFLFVNSKNITLLDVIDLAKSNGWTEQDVLDGFEFMPRKSKDHKYDILNTSKLKSTLELINTQKDKNC